jgi:hypothetical protein
VGDDIGVHELGNPQIVAEPLREVCESLEDSEEYLLPMMRGKSDGAFRKPLMVAIEAAGQRT